MRRGIRLIGSWLVLSFVLAVVAGCGTSGAAPSAAPSAGDATEGVVATFRVADVENYKIRLVRPEHIDIARKLLAGEEAPAIPNGVVVRGDADVNTGYSWHIDPDTLEFADVTMEVCDGLPSDVEQELITSDRYCPWLAEVIAIE